MIKKYLLDFIYPMPWKFVYYFKFHEILKKATIILQITKGNEEIEEIEKYSKKPL